MKKAILLLVFLLVFGTAGRGWAAVFNVSTPAGFQTALTTAESNGEDDTINVAAGTYDVSGGTLTYLPAAGENYSLTIQGAGAGSTILDGGGSVQILNVDTSGLADDSSANIIIMDMTFQNGANSAGSGGGLYAAANSAYITVEDSEFTDNFTGGGGGAYVYTDSGAVTLTNNTFTGNLAAGGGGAAAVSDTGTVILTNNTFTGNVAFFAGGGAAAVSDTGTVILTNNTFTGNVAGGGGGAFAGSDTGTVTLTNNTFTGNSAVGGDAGGLYVSLLYNSATANIYNNIIWGNIAAATGGDLYVADDGDSDGTGATVNLYNNDFSDFVIDDGDNLSQGGNIDQDPLLNASFHLQAGSPCIDVGDNGAPSLPATDFDGEARIMNGTVDMGADEYTDLIVAPTAIPTMTEWGMIIFMVLAGLGSVYYLRRQRAKG